MAKQDDYVRITIRIPKGVHAALAEKCEGEAHSLNAEIVQRLVRSIDEENIKNRVREFVMMDKASDEAPGDVIREKLQALIERVVQDADALRMIVEAMPIEKP
jgi:hypothetical protein